MRKPNACFMACEAEYEEAKTVLFGAPFDGTVSSVTDTHHAVGLSSQSGMEVLIHVGIDTVDMKGDGFTCFVKEGDAVVKGQKLLTFDRAKIAAAHHSDMVAVLLANSDDYTDVRIGAAAAAH